MSKETQIVGLDVGTSAVRAVAVAFDATGGAAPRVLGSVSERSRGIRKGQIIHIEDAVASIDRAMTELERVAGFEPKNIIVGITGSHIDSFSSHGVVPIKAAEVRRQDIQRVVEAAQAVPISADREVLHVIPQEFVVDGQTGIKDPLGISGVRLEASVLILTAASFGAQNIMKCVNKCGYSVSEIVFSPIATGLALLQEEEVEQGVCLIDLGAGTTEIGVFFQGVLASGHVLGIGGQHVTNDLAAGLRTSIRDAEALKLEMDLSASAPNHMISIPEIGREEHRAVSASELRAIAVPRVEEILLLVKKELAKHVTNPAMLSGGVVLTGGGARLQGISELAEAVLELPCRVRFEALVSESGEKDALPGEFATAFGLGCFQRHSRMIFGNRSQHGSSRWYSRITHWLAEHF
jgi:cell division protein FtsA